MTLQALTRSAATRCSTCHSHRKPPRTAATSCYLLPCTRDPPASLTRGLGARLRRLPGATEFARSRDGLSRPESPILGSRCIWRSRALTTSCVSSWRFFEASRSSCSMSGHSCSTWAKPSLERTIVSHDVRAQQAAPRLPLPWNSAPSPTKSPTYNVLMTNMSFSSTMMSTCPRRMKNISVPMVPLRISHSPCGKAAQRHTGTELDT